MTHRRTELTFTVKVLVEHDDDETKRRRIENVHHCLGTPSDFAGAYVTEVTVDSQVEYIHVPKKGWELV